MFWSSHVLGEPLGRVNDPALTRSQNLHGCEAVTDLEAAWNEIHDAKPDGWFVGPTTHEEHRHEWRTYAFDTRERPKAGHRSWEWTAVAASELEVVREDGALPATDRPGAAAGSGVGYSTGPDVGHSPTFTAVEARALHRPPGGVAHARASTVVTRASLFLIAPT